MIGPQWSSAISDNAQQAFTSANGAHTIHNFNSIATNNPKISSFRHELIIYFLQTLEFRGYVIRPYRSVHSVWWKSPNSELWSGFRTSVLPLRLPSFKRRFNTSQMLSFFFLSFSVNLILEVFFKTLLKFYEMLEKLKNVVVIGGSYVGLVFHPY